MSLVATKARHELRRNAKRCIYDRRDTGGPAHGEPVKGDRCVECWKAKLISAKRRRREVQLDKWKAKLRGARDPLFVQRCKQNVARLVRELQDLACAVNHGPVDGPHCEKHRESA